MTENIYKQLFDMTIKNNTNSKNIFTNKENTFLFYCKSDNYSVDISELMKIKADNEEFIQIAYIALLNRPVDPDAVNMWSVFYYQPQKKFRTNVIHSILTSNEFANNKKKIYNNTVRKSPQNILIRGAYKVYRKCPGTVKDLVKKTAGRISR